MDKNTILDQLKNSQEAMEKYKVKSIALFGSFARGDETSESDVDLLVEFNGPTSYDHYIGLRFFLEDLLGSHIDLITHKGVRPEIRPTVEREAIYVT